MLYENRPKFTAIMNAIHKHAEEPRSIFHATAVRVMLSNISRYGDEFAATHKDDDECAAKLLAYIYDRRSIESRNYLQACEYAADECGLESRRNASEARWLHKDLLDELNSVLNGVWRVRYEVEHPDRDRRSPEKACSDFWHGRKPAAYQVKHGERNAPDTWPGYWTEHKTSKCWKDQRGKGRNKRNRQYRPVEM